MPQVWLYPAGRLNAPPVGETRYGSYLGKTVMKEWWKLNVRYRFLAGTAVYVGNDNPLGAKSFTSSSCIYARGWDYPSGTPQWHYQVDIINHAPLAVFGMPVIAPTSKCALP